MSHLKIFDSSRQKFADLNVKIQNKICSLRSQRCKMRLVELFFKHCDECPHMPSHHILEYRKEKEQKTHHFAFPFLRHPHFFEHLITLFHQQRPFVGVFGNGRVVQFHYVNVSFNPEEESELPLTQIAFKPQGRSFESSSQLQQWQNTP